MVDLADSAPPPFPTGFVLFLTISTPVWLERASVPCFVSQTRLSLIRQKFPRAAVPWCCDSGGFFVIGKYGYYPWTARAYAENVRRYRDEIGNMVWAATQDWMCEPSHLRMTGLTVRDHVVRTVYSYHELMSIDPTLPWCPVLQGWTVDDYLRCADMYYQSGVDLSRIPTVGVGSVCARQSSLEAEMIFREIYRRFGLRMHGFGVKVGGLERYRHLLVSSDSGSWSFRARKLWQLGLASAGDRNSLAFAENWAGEVLARIGEA